MIGEPAGCKHAPYFGDQEFRTDEGTYLRAPKLLRRRVPCPASGFCEEENDKSKLSLYKFADICYMGPYSGRLTPGWIMRSAAIISEQEVFVAAWRITVPAGYMKEQDWRSPRLQTRVVASSPGCGNHRWKRAVAGNITSDWLASTGMKNLEQGSVRWR